VKQVALIIWKVTVARRQLGDFCKADYLGGNACSIYVFLLLELGPVWRASFHCFG
jgi:hypothetical protein